MFIVFVLSTNHLYIFWYKECKDIVLWTTGVTDWAGELITNGLMVCCCVVVAFHVITAVNLNT